MRAEQARAYVESLLYRFVGGDRVVADHDGDYRVWFRDCLYFVRVIGHDVPVVQVFSVAVADVGVTPELLTELNTLNAEIQFARAYHLRQQILIETDVLAEDFDPASFENACSHVETVTLEMAPSLAARFGGRLTFANRLTLAAVPDLAELAVLSEVSVTAEVPTSTDTPALATSPLPAGLPALASTPETAQTPATPEEATAEKARTPAKARNPVRKRATAKARAPHDVPTAQNL